jgi:hypothetical protein
MSIHSLFYKIKPLIPRQIQLILRRQIAQYKREMNADVWPILPEAACPPRNWQGWPNGKRFSFVLTHDVEKKGGHDKVLSLMRLEQELGFRSSFNFVPERYTVSADVRQELQANGFEVGVHGILHDGKLYASRAEFRKRARRINKHLQAWGAVGFRSPAMHHNLDWLHDLNIEYDASTFDTDPFEPQSEGVGTIFPFWIPGDDDRPGYMELPYTLPQDHGLFIILQEKNVDIWKKKLDWIAKKGGMALLNVHPDYMNFDGIKLAREEFPADYYREFLIYVKEKYAGEYWHVLPKDMAAHCATNKLNIKRTIGEGNDA